MRELANEPQRNVEDRNNKQRNVEVNTEYVVEQESNSNMNQQTRAFPCDTCYKVFQSKSGLARHIDCCERITHPLQCPKCLKILASVSGKSHHVKICKAERPVEATTNNIQTQNIVHGNQQNVTIQNQQIIQNQHNYNIELRAFGNEDVSHITSAKLESYLTRVKDDGLVLLATDIHFNKDVPQNRNIEVISSKNKTVRVYSGNNQWSVRARLDAINEIFKKSHDMMWMHFKENYRNVLSHDHQFYKQQLENMRSTYSGRYGRMVKSFFDYMVDERDKQKNLSA